MKFLFLFLIMIRASLDYYSNVYILGANIGSYVGIAIIGIAFIEYEASKKKQRNIILKGFLVYLILVLPSLFSSLYIKDSLMEVTRYLCELSCMFLTYKYFFIDKRFANKLIIAILYSSLIPNIYGIIQVATGSGFYDKDVGGNRVCSVFMHPNQYAIYLVVICTACLLIYTGKINLTKKKNLKISYLVFATSIINLLFTYSRTCWIWFGIIVMGHALLTLKYKKSKVFIVCAAVLLYYMSDFFVARFMDVISAYTKNSLDIRSRIVAVMFEKFKEKPLFGYGVGTFSSWTNIILGKQIEAHNEYIRTLFETGLCGIFGLIYYFFVTIKSFIKDGIKNNSIMIMFLVGFYIACFFTNTLDCLVGQIYLVTLVTLVYCIGMTNVTWQKGRNV